MKNPKVAVVLVILALGALGYLAYDMTKAEPPVSVWLKAEGAEDAVQKEIVPGTTFPVEIEGKKYYEAFPYYNPKTKKLQYFTSAELGEGKIPAGYEPGTGPVEEKKE